MTVAFQSASNVEEFAAGYDANGTVDPSQLLTISASQVFTIQGAAQFTVTPTNQVNVSVPTATVSISIPDANGNFPTTPTFSITGSAQFTIGGSSGFQLQSLRVNGFSIFGVSATIQNPATTLVPPTATLVSPMDGQSISLSQLNSQGYIEVHYNDFDGTGIDAAKILSSSGQFTISGSGAGTATILNPPTLASANDNSDFIYKFEGQFSVPSGNSSSTVTLAFTPGSYADNSGETNAAQDATFTIYNSATAPTYVGATLANPANGATVNDQSMDQLGYIDVTYNLPSGESIATTTVSGQPVTTLTGDEISLTLPAGSNIAVDAMGHPESLVNGQYTVIPPRSDRWKYIPVFPVAKGRERRVDHGGEPVVRRRPGHGEFQFDQFDHSNRRHDRNDDSESSAVGRNLHGQRRRQH